MSIAIIPAIIPESLDDLREHLDMLIDVAPRVQIDVCDGVFVSRKSWPYSHLASFKAIEQQDEGLPHWESYDFDVDLMVADPITEAERWAIAGASTVIVHLDALLKRGVPVIEEVQALRERVRVVCALSCTANVADIATYCGDVDGIQCMGIARIGFQGESFDERVLKQIAAAKTMYPLLEISVDGAVSDQTLESLIKAGATTLVVGSAIFNCAIPSEQYRELLAQADAILSV